MADPAELVRGADLLELVLVFDQAQAVQGVARVGELGGQGVREPYVGSGQLRRDSDPPSIRHDRHGGDGFDQPGHGVEVDAEAPFAESDDLVGGRQLPRDSSLVEHHGERALAVAPDDERGRAAEVAPVPAKVVDVVGSEDDGAVQLLVVHPGSETLEPVGRPRHRDLHASSSLPGMPKACASMSCSPTS